MESLTVEPGGSKDYGPCECCGNNSRCVSGFVSSCGAAFAAYFVHWTVGRVADHGANFDLVLGKWGNAASANDRVLVSLAYRLTSTGPEFMVIDAQGRLDARAAVAARAMQRAEVIGLPIAEQAFAVVDAILDSDSRVAELLGNNPQTRTS